MHFHGDNAQTSTTWQCFVAVNGADYDCFCELSVEVQSWRESHGENMEEATIELDDFSAKDMSGVEIEDKTLLKAIRREIEGVLERDYELILRKI